MNSIVKTFFRDKKSNLIYILLISIILIFIFIFMIITNYYKYCINEVYGKKEENRGYIIEINDSEFIEELRANFSIEKAEPNYDKDKTTIKSYYVVIAYYKDTDNFVNYVSDKNITMTLANSTKIYEIKILENNLRTFKILEFLSIIVSFISIYFVLKSIDESEEKNNIILKCIGYKNRRIVAILSLKILLLMILGIILANVFIYIFHFSYLIINQEIMISFLKQLNFKKFISISLYSLLILIINIIWYHFKIRKAL